MPRPPLKDGIVLLTGASSGIGREMARQLAGTAKVLILVARRQDRLQELRAELQSQHPKLNVNVQPCDLTDLPSIAEMLQRVHQDVGQVNVLINNAGLGSISLLEYADWDQIEAMIKVNITALTYLTFRMVKPMVEKGEGGILNVSSGFGLTVMPVVAAYAATKHYVTAFTEGLRMDLAGTGVVVSQVCPGPVATEFEQVSGNPTGQEVPKFLQVSPKYCARETLKGFARGKALIMPGFPVAPLTMMGAMTPRAILRAVYSPLGKYMRERQGRS